MINLLPIEEKEKLILKKKEKLTMIFGIVVLVSLICLVLILLSIKFYILAETDSQKNILLQIQQKNQIPNFANLNSTVKRYNGVLAQLISFYEKEIYFNRALKTIADIPSPDGLYLTNFSLIRDKTGKVKASVSGNSATRENLLVYKKNIEDNKEIENPYFSPGSWISQKNVNFLLTFEIYQNEKQ